MATPAAAAALFAAALNPIASTSNSHSSLPNHPSLTARLSQGTNHRPSVPRPFINSGRGGSFPIRGQGGQGRGVVRRDEDVGMVDADRGTAKRRGRSGRAANPMGERPKNDRTNDRNLPTVLRSDASSSRSTGRASTSTPQGPPSVSAIETLRVFLMSRYSPQDKMLNLENMAGDSVLRTAGLKAPGERDAPTNVAGAMWKLAAGLFPEVVSLSLANNRLTSLLPLSPFMLTTYLPNLVNVSLASNSLGMIRDVDCLSPAFGKKRRENGPKGWSQLQELVLTGNPLVETGEQHEAYRSEIARRFPTLRQLDQQPIDPATIVYQPIKSTASRTSDKPTRTVTRVVREPVVFPLPVSSGFFESEGTRDFVAGFFMKYFPAYDTSRPSLLPVYAPSCTFSYFIDSTVPSRSKAKRIGGYTDKKHPFQRALDWKLYTTPEGSRNLSRVKSPSKRIATLQVTPADVITSIVKLPVSAHPLTDPTKFVFDAWTMPGLLAPTAPGIEGETVIYAIVHGEFTEFPAKGIRSFDRTFILAPAPPGSAAQQGGWPCVILSDSLTVRSYSDPQAWAIPEPKVDSAPVPVTPTASASTNGIAAAPIVLERAEGLTDPQQSLILSLQHHTKLTYSFSHLCLVQNNWDPTAAMSNFVALQTSGGIPPQAFMS